MLYQVASIKDNEHFEYKGDVVVTGSIGKNATVIVQDGSLTVEGSIGSESYITLQAITQSVSITSGSFSIFRNNNVVIGGNNSFALVVKGNVDSSVKITSQNAEFTVDGSVGNNSSLKTHNGSINTGDIGTSVSVVTHNGDVRIGNMGASSTAKTSNGDLKAGNVESNSSVTSHNGDVKVLSADKSAHLKTHNGDVYENGTKREKAPSQLGSSFMISIGGMSVISRGLSVGSGQIIVNGKDITDLVNQQAATSSSQEVLEEEQQPIRFQK